jgi:hypothetical protein
MCKEMPVIPVNRVVDPKRGTPKKKKRKKKILVRRTAACPRGRPT